MYEAIKSFSGAVSMTVGEVRAIEDANVVKDLLRAGYIREVKPATKVEATEEKEEAKPKAKKPVTRAKKSGVK